MAYTHYTNTNSATETLAQGISNAILGFASRIATYARYRKTVRELSALGARELDDLGLNYSSIRSAAWESAQSH